MNKHQFSVEVESVREDNQSIMNVKFICHLDHDFIGAEAFPVSIHEDEVPLYKETENHQEVEELLINLIGYDRLQTLKERAILLVKAQL